MGERSSVNQAFSDKWPDKYYRINNFQTMSDSFHGKMTKSLYKNQKITGTLGITINYPNSPELCEIDEIHLLEHLDTRRLSMVQPIDFTSESSDHLQLQDFWRRLSLPKVQKISYIFLLIDYSTLALHVDRAAPILKFFTSAASALILILKINDILSVFHFDLTKLPKQQTDTKTVLLENDKAKLKEVALENIVNILRSTTFSDSESKVQDLFENFLKVQHLVQAYIPIWYIKTRLFKSFTANPAEKPNIIYLSIGKTLKKVKDQITEVSLLADNTDFHVTSHSQLRMLQLRGNVVWKYDSNRCPVPFNQLQFLKINPLSNSQLVPDLPPNMFPQLVTLTFNLKENLQPVHLNIPNFPKLKMLSLSGFSKETSVDFGQNSVCTLCLLSIAGFQGEMKNVSSCYITRLRVQHRKFDTIPYEALKKQSIYHFVENRWLFTSRGRADELMSAYKALQKIAKDKPYADVEYPFCGCCWY